MRFLLSASALVLGASLAAQAPAATFTVNSVSGVWQNDQPDAGVLGEGTSTLRWGFPVGASTVASRLSFTAAATPFSVADSTTFSLGSLTHLNSRVVGPTLTAADLVFSIDVAGVGPITSTFSVTHWETPDFVFPCPLSPSLVNIRGCADQVTGTWNAALSDTFRVGGTIYALEILGFSTPALQFNTFWTAEIGENVFDIVADFTPVAQVPLPVAGLGLAAALVTLPVVARRRRTAA